MHFLALLANLILVTSAFAHDASRITQLNNDMGWREVSRDEAISILRKDNRGAWGVYPENHAATVRVQWWLDQIDSKLRKEFPNQLRDTPEPKVLVYSDYRATASAQSASLCTPLETRLNYGETSDYVNYIMPQNGHVTSIRRSDCLQAPKEWTVTKDDFFKKVETLLSEPCRISRAGDYVEFAAGCKSSSGEMAAQAVVIPVTINYVFVTDSIMRFFEDENRFLAVITHELAHYYRRHPSVRLPGQYNFPYQRSAQSFGVVPTEDKNLYEIYHTLERRQNEISHWDFVPPVAGQRYHSKISNRVFNEGGVRFDWLNQGIEKFCSMNPAKCSKSCQSYVSLVRLPETQALARQVHLGLSETQRVDYLHWENALAACAKTVESDWLEYDSNYLNFDPVEMPFRQYPKMLSDLLAEFSHKIKVHEDSLLGMLSESAAKNLGVYTAEQEADELSAQLLDVVGINPKVAPDAELQRIKRGEEIGRYNHLVQGDIPQTECHEYRERNWKAPDGGEIYISVGNIHDPHHSLCFRVYDLDRDIQAHGYSNHKNAKNPRPPGPAWAELLNGLAD